MPTPVRFSSQAKEEGDPHPFLGENLVISPRYLRSGNRRFYSRRDQSSKYLEWSWNDFSAIAAHCAPQVRFTKGDMDHLGPVHGHSTCMHIFVKIKTGPLNAQFNFLFSCQIISLRLYLISSLGFSIHLTKNQFLCPYI